MDHTSRVVVLVDMDCFYCQVEEKLDPKLTGKPIAVVQYNQWKGGGIIAVNYPARDKGVTRHMRGADAKKRCPELQLVSVPCLRGKADLTKYREAGKRVAEVLQTFTNLLERASVDEAYLDITEAVNKRIELQYMPESQHLPNTHIAGCDKDNFIENVKNNFTSEGDLKLCVGGVITEEIRAAVYAKTGYKCSAGVAHNKILAKLACGLYKPNQQTLLPQSGIDEVYKTLPIRKIKSLGGKFGELLGEDLGISTMADLNKFSERELIQRYDEKTGFWLYNIARGIDCDPVTVRLVSKSIGCCKKFPGRTALTTFDDVSHWINELSEELSERLTADMEENNRKAKQMVVGFSQEINRKDVASSRTHPLNSYEFEKIAADMLNVINKHCMREDGSYRIKYMGISAGKFEENKKMYDLTNFFNKSKENCNGKSQIVSSTPKRNSNTLLNFLTSESKESTSPVFIANEKSISKDDDNNIVTESITKQHEIQRDFTIDDGVFLNTTAEIETDLNNVIFNRNCVTPDLDFLDFIKCTSNMTDESDDSITEEIIASNTPKKEITPKKQSYFSTFFNNIQTPSTSKERNFDTSRHLEELFELSPQEIQENDEDLGIQPIQTNIERESPVLSNRTDLHIVENESDGKSRCSECNKLIPISELPSHLDYHFALKIVREEAHLYTNENNLHNMSKINKVGLTNQKKSKRKTTQNKVPCTKLASFLAKAEVEDCIEPFEKKSTNISRSTKFTLTDQKNKRKAEVHCNKLDLFLSTAKKEIEGPTETCPECNKKIATNSFSDHLDYHAARKLHMELNSVTSAASAKVDKNKKKNGIVSYFKQNL